MSSAYYCLIYPSQRHNLPASLEIRICNIPKFSKIFKISKKIRISIFPENFQNHRGAATEIRGTATSLLKNIKIFIFSLRMSKSRSTWFCAIFLRWKLNGHFVRYSHIRWKLGRALTELNLTSWSARMIGVGVRLACKSESWNQIRWFALLMLGCLQI